MTDIYDIIAKVERVGAEFWLHEEGNAVKVRVIEFTEHNDGSKTMRFETVETEEKPEPWCYTHGVWSSQCPDQSCNSDMT